MNTPSSKDITLIPDGTILMQARLAAGDHRSLKLKDVANLLLHDPVLTAEFLQSANSSLYSGAAVSDLDSALARIGSQQLAAQLSDLTNRKIVVDDQVAEAFEVLRYNARRVSIVSLIIAAAIKPQLTVQVRMAGLMAESGHMVALLKLGKTYCEVAKANSRKNLPFRLEKDHKINVDSLRINYLRNKGMPAKIIVPYDLDMDTKTPVDVDIRACVRSAMEMIDAFDTGKFSNYKPDKPLPSHSSLRLLKVSPVQTEKLYKTISDYLERISAQEEPEGAAVFLQTTQEDSVIDLNEGAPDNLKVPNYPVTIIKPNSQEKLQPLVDICSTESADEEVRNKAVDFLVQSGFFKRAAFVKIHPDSDEATITYSAGFDEMLTKKIVVQDPLSPFKMFKSKIKSFSSKAGKLSAPFGVSAYAVGPIAVTAEGNRLILYADSAGLKGLTLDLRSVFRVTMNLLSTRLQK